MKAEKYLQTNDYERWDTLYPSIPAYSGSMVQVLAYILKMEPRLSGDGCVPFTASFFILIEMTIDNSWRTIGDQIVIHAIMYMWDKNINTLN